MVPSRLPPHRIGRIAFDAAWGKVLITPKSSVGISPDVF